MSSAALSFDASFPHANPVRDANCSLGRSWSWPCSNWTVTQRDVCMKKISHFVPQNLSFVWPLSQSRFRWLWAPDCGKRMCFEPIANNSGSISQFETKLQGASPDDFLIFCDFFHKGDDSFKELCKGGASGGSSSNCFYSVILSANYVQRTVGRPPIKVHVWVNLESNRDFSQQDELEQSLSSHHIEVYRGHARHHRVHLRIFFAISIIINIYFQIRHPWLKKMSIHDFQPLVIFLWLSFVSLLPEAHGSPHSSNDAVKSSTYLVMSAFAHCIRAILNLRWIKGTQKSVYFCGAGVVTALLLGLLSLLSSSHLLFPNFASREMFWRLLTLLSLNLIAGMKLRRDNQKSDSNVFVVIFIHTIGVVLLFFLYPPALFAFDDDCILFIFIRLVEVCARRPVRPPRSAHACPGIRVSSLFFPC
jgi:hypothetical protein